MTALSDSALLQELKWAGTTVQAQPADLTKIASPRRRARDACACMATLYSPVRSGTRRPVEACRTRLSLADFLCRFADHYWRRVSFRGGHDQRIMTLLPHHMPRACAVVTDIVHDEERHYGRCAASYIEFPRRPLPSRASSCEGAVALRSAWTSS